MFAALAETDAARSLDDRGRIAPGRHAQAERAAQQAAAVLVEADPESLAELARAVGDLPVGDVSAQAAKPAHRRGALHGLQRPQQQGCGPAGRLADDVGAGVDAVAPVGVEVRGRAKHGAIARGLTPVCVGARVAAVAQVGLDLDDPPDQLPAVGQAPDQIGAEQLGAHLEARSLEELPREASARPHPFRLERLWEGADGWL